MTIIWLPEPGNQWVSLGLQPQKLRQQVNVNTPLQEILALRSVAERDKDGICWLWVKMAPTEKKMVSMGFVE